jgi:hypothetical protein
MVYLLKAKTVKPAVTAMLGNVSVKTPSARQWHSSRYVIAGTDTQATIEELLEVVFSVWFVSSLNNEGQISL